MRGSAARVRASSVHAWYPFAVSSPGRWMSRRGEGARMHMRTTAWETTLNLRVSAKQKELIRRAAPMRGQTMTEFVLSAVEPLARELVERERAIELSEAAWQEFVRMAEANVP